MEKDKEQLKKGGNQGGSQHLEVETGELTTREKTLNAGKKKMEGKGAGLKGPLKSPALTAGGGFEEYQYHGIENISGPEEENVKARALEQNDGLALKDEPIKKGRGNKGPKDQALVIREVDSMADDPGFEARAKVWEMKFGGVVATDARTQAMADKAAGFVKNYLMAKYGEWKRGNEALEAVLKKTGMDSKTFSGAVGSEVEKVMDALDNGSVTVKMSHFQNFTSNVLPQEILETDDIQLNKILESAGVDPENPATSGAIGRARKNQRMQSAEGIAGDQWHMRAKRNHPEGPGSKRTHEDFKAQTGMDFSDQEKAHMELDKAGKDDRLPTEEGGEIWALNERDKWVNAMRKMSLPLLAGPSGTTARLMQAFDQFNLNQDNAMSRLACIGYILPNRHHSLVEIMTGAAGNGGPDFTPSKQMYRNIAPFKPAELRTRVGPFPDEVAE